MKDTHLNQILSELYQSDPALQAHEEVLKKLIVDLISLKPDTKFDEGFRLELRRKLTQMTETQLNTNSFLNFNFMKRFSLAGAAVAICVLLFVSVIYYQQNSSPTNLTSLLSGPKISKANDNAFGNLANLQAGARGMGGGGGGNEVAAAPTADKMAVGVGGGGSTSMFAPEPYYNYKFVYKGEPLELNLDKVDVLKRLKDEGNNNLSDFINRISLGLINLNSFENSKLQSFTFAEDKDLGYMVNVIMSEGSVNINENWSKWQNIYGCPMPLSVDRMVSPVCEPKRNIISDIPSDQELIDIANQFLDGHGIPRSNYGEPFVNSDWRRDYDRSTDKTNYWVPDVVSVVYPLMLEGQNVYDESGNFNGMNVAVRVPNKKVSSVYELTTQSYQSSSYSAETDSKRILGLAERGGFRNYYYMDPNVNTKTVEVELGDPKLSFVKLWNYQEGISEELLVPSLIFPILKEPENAPYWYKKNIVVPLVKEILDSEGPLYKTLEKTTNTVEGSVVVPAPATTPKAK